MLHLIHPALVHVSVAFVVVGGLCEIWARLRDHEAGARWAGPLLLVGLASLIPTIVTGYLAANTAPALDARSATLGAHERNGWILLGFFTLALFWKAWVRGQLPEGQRRLYALALVVGVLLTAYSAILGGEMVYLVGVGVGR